MRKASKAWGGGGAGMAELSQEQAVYEACPGERRYELPNDRRPIEVPGSILQTWGYS